VEIVEKDEGAPPSGAQLLRDRPGKLMERLLQKNLNVVKPMSQGASRNRKIDKSLGQYTGSTRRSLAQETDLTKKEQMLLKLVNMRSPE